MDWLRNLIAKILGERKRCEIQHCWLDATKRIGSHHLCETHHHEYTYDVGISGKKL